MLVTHLKKMNSFISSDDKVNAVTLNSLNCSNPSGIINSSSQLNFQFNESPLMSPVPSFFSTPSNSHLSPPKSFMDQNTL